MRAGESTTEGLGDRGGSGNPEDECYRQAVKEDTTLSVLKSSAGVIPERW